MRTLGRRRRLVLCILVVVVATTTGLSSATATSDSGRLRPHRLPLSGCGRYAAVGVDVAVCEQQIVEARAATAKYLVVTKALADGYIPISSCEQTAAGAMGIHFARPDRMITPSLIPTAPAILLYLPTASGLRLIGAEYEASATVGGLPYYGLTPPPVGSVNPAPRMFGGKKFDGPMQGHIAVQPWHYDLHVWLFATNPSGIFAQYNPSLRC